MQTRSSVQPYPSEPKRDSASEVYGLAMLAARSPVALRIQRRSAAFSHALSGWRRLSTEASALLAPEMALLALKLLPPTAEPWLVCARRAGSVETALPVVRHGRTLRPLAFEHTPRFDLVGDPDGVPALWTSLRALPGWDVLELRGVPADSPLATRLPELAEREGYRQHVREIGRSPWFPIEGIEQRIHRRFRGDMRRLEKQLGGVELEVVRRFDRGALEDLFRIEAAGWKGESGTAIACDPKLVRYYCGLARVLAGRGQLVIAFLRAHGKRIAACFAVEDRTTFYLVKIAYDPEYAHYGPGQLLVRETAADAGARGLLRYDLLGKDTPYKMKWTDRVRSHVEIVLYAPTLGGFARHWVKEVARPAAGRGMRAVRRTLATVRPSQAPVL